MSRPLKIMLAVVGATLAALALLVAFLPGLDSDMVKGRISGVIQDVSGLEVRFEGPIKARTFPSVGLELNQVVVRAPQDMGGGVLARLGRADISVKLLPLLSGRVETGQITLEGLEADIVRDAQGRLNFPTPKVKEVKVEGQNVVVITDSDKRYSINYQIAGVRVTGSRFSYDDRGQGSVLKVNNIALSTEAIQSGKPFAVKLGMDYAVTNPDVQGRMDLSGQAMMVLEAMRFAFENAAFSFKAQSPALPVKRTEANCTGTLRADLDKQVFSAEKLTLKASGAGGMLPDAGAGFTLALDANADMGQGLAELKSLSLDAMGFTLNGSAKATDIKGKPKFDAALATNEFAPAEVLRRFGVELPAGASGTVLVRFKAQGDLGAGTADITEATLKALGLDLSSTLHVTNIQAEPSATGSIKVAPFNPRDLAAKLGQKLPAMADPAALTRAEMAFDLKSDPAKATLRSTVLRLDDSSMTLNADIEPGDIPKVNLALTVDALDADRYMPTDQPAQQAKAPAKEQAKTEDIAVQATGNVAIGKLKAAKLHMQDIKVRFGLKNNVLDVNPLQLALYQGSVKAQASADLRGGPSAPVSVNAVIDGVQVEPLLTDMQGKSPVAGRLNASANVATRGLDAAHALPNLNGKAAFALRGGALLGFDLSPEVLTNRDKLMAQGKGQGRTAIDAASASFSIAKGVASTSDVLASASALKVTGQGWINLVAQTLDMRLVAAFAKLAAIPVHITGPMKDVSVNVDAAAVAKGVLDTVVKTPQNVIEAPSSLGKGALDAVGNILGGPKKK